MEHTDQIRKLEDEFRAAWANDQKPIIKGFLQGLSENEFVDALKILIPIDIEHRAMAGEVVDYQNYLPLGEAAAEIAGDYFSIDNTPGPDEATRITQGNDQDDKADLTILSSESTAEKTNRLVEGKYKMIHQIGTGGMGTVWLAQQEKPVRRRVALKVIRGNLDSMEAIKRFEAERQALAMMNHPNIAQVLDAGTMDDGSPYFVMELVRGVPLTRYCNENRLNLTQRLELMLPVCDAVQHAHQKGIIHRDIKPSNVLVCLQNDRPVPKVIDFGLAKALEQQTRLTDETMFTEHGRVIGTLQFMSPEQAASNELDVDARTDIYSLGVMLYQLLTGATPLSRESVANNNLIKIIEKICSDEIEPPSQRLKNNLDDLTLVSGQRKIEPRKLIALLQGELDWVVLKALAKDRTQRYQTAEALSDDLGRFVGGEAVLARPPSAGYLFKKFMRKRKGLVLSVGIATLLLLSGTFTSTYFAIKANRLKTRADQQLNVYRESFAATNPLAGADKNMSAVDVLQQAEAILADEMQNDPIGQAALLHEIGKSYWGQSRFDLAVAALTKAFDIRSSVLGSSNPLTWETQEELAIAYQTSDIDKMIALMTDVYEQKRNRFSSDSQAMMEARHVFATANFFAFKEKRKQGVLQNEKIALAQKIFEQNFKFQMKRLGIDHPDTLKTATNLANVYLKAGNTKSSLELMEKAVAAWKRKVLSAANETERNKNRTNLLMTQNNYAEAMAAAGQIEASIELFQHVLKEKSDVLGIGHKSWQTSLRLLLTTLVQDNQQEKAKSIFESVLAEIREDKGGFDCAEVEAKLTEMKRKIIEKFNLEANWTLQSNQNPVQ